MKNFKFMGALFIALGLILSACAGKSAPIQSTAVSPSPDACSTPVIGTTGSCQKDVANTLPTNTPQLNPASADLTRTDSQGAVTVEVKPENFDDPGDTLVFDIAMNTHLVDLSMDLAKLATLTTDNGNTVQAASWDGANGGHHVSGKLSFPATYDGKPLLAGVKEVTLTIKDVDTPSRLFTWQLSN